METQFEKIMNYENTNRIVYKMLCELMNNKKESVLPFVGAGISAFTYNTWEGLLLELAQNIDIKEKHRVQKAIQAGDYFSAADIVNSSYGELLFYKKLRDFFSEDKINDRELKKNAAFLIPRICNGNCITTNFDRILEHACNLNNIIPDKALPTDTNKLNEYLRNGNRRSALIFKIHGDILSNKNNIVLTRKSYDVHYGEKSQLRTQLIRWIDSKNLLFLGASLKHDKTVEILKDCMEEGMYNYAIYGCTKKEIPELKKHFETLNIMGIFYDSNNHDNVRTILSRLIKDTKS